MPIPLLLFSGGMDSTFMLQQALQQGDVEVLYVVGGQCPNKAEKERSARRKIIRKLELITGNYVYKDHLVETHQLFTGMSDVTWGQPPMWIAGALQVIDHQRHSELRIGYVMGDGILQQLDNIDQAWRYLQLIAKSQNVPIKFPLRTTCKTEIMNHIDPRVWDDVWVCELPVVKGAGSTACNSCVPCLTIASERYKWQLINGDEHASYEAYVRHRLAALPTLTQLAAIQREKNRRQTKAIRAIPLTEITE